MTPVEALRHQIRQALGQFNEPKSDVVSLVRRVSEALEAKNSLRTDKSISGPDSQYADCWPDEGSCAGS